MLQACLNGGRTRCDHPAVPYSPDDLATDARAVVAAGAEELHVHPRGPGGHESLASADVAAALQAIRESVPGIPVGISSGWWIAPGGRSRQQCIREWSVLPDYISVNLIEDDSPEIISLALARGIGVEAGLWSVRDAQRFVSLQEAPRCLRVLIEINEQDEREGLAVAYNILALLDKGQLHVPRLLHGSDTTVWRLYLEANRLGLNTRIGLEDGYQLPSGEIATNNAALITAARAVAVSFQGRSTASARVG